MMKLWTRQRSQRGIGFAVHAPARARLCSNGSWVKQQVYASTVSEALVRWRVVPVFPQR